MNNMLNPHLLLRKSQTIITYLNDHLTGRSFGNISEIFSMMRTLQSIFPQWVLLSCPAQHPGFFFITDNCKSVLGFSIDDLAGVDHAAFLLSRVHEADIPDMHKCFSFMESFLKETMPDDYTKLRFVMNYRFVHKDGHIIHIRHEKAMLAVDNVQPVYYSIIRDVSTESNFCGVQLEIHLYNGVMKKLAEYIPQQSDARLSRREYDIITLMQTGLSNKQIAQRLKISQHTARNIKQRMFTKYGVNNSITLLNKTMHLVEK